jgi:hypothetical protein
MFTFCCVLSWQYHTLQIEILCRHSCSGPSCDIVGNWQSKQNIRQVFYEDKLQQEVIVANAGFRPISREYRCIRDNLVPFSEG